MKYPILLLTVLLTSCSAQHHLRKAIAKDPTILTEGVAIETVRDTIVVVTEELRVDTVHEWSVDTVTTYVDRVRIRTKVDTVTRTVFVDVVCPPDTVFVPYEYEKTVIQPVVKPRITAWQSWGFIAFIAWVVLAFRWITHQIRK